MSPWQHNRDKSAALTRSPLSIWPLLVTRECWLTVQSAGRVCAVDKPSEQRLRNRASWAEPGDSPDKGLCRPGHGLAISWAEKDWAEPQSPQFCNCLLLQSPTPTQPGVSPQPGPTEMTKGRPLPPGENASVLYSSPCPANRGDSSNPESPS